MPGIHLLDAHDGHTHLGRHNGQEVFLALQLVDLKVQRHVLGTLRSPQKRESMAWMHYKTEPRL